MPLGHERINAREQDPNDHITFIRALEGYPDHDQALHLLKCLAAQFKPIMKEWGFGVNSLVEYEPNPEFAGRNWNAGEIIEIVLRRRDGSFLPWNFILMVMCHEQAHIKEMNHSWAFQKVNKQIRQALSVLRQQGYTGDGFYSRGRSLNPNYEGNVDALGMHDGPTYTCGGALKKRRKRRRLPTNGEETNAGPRRERGSAVKLGTTGRQTRIATKAGGRVTKKGAFVGEGRALGAKSDEEEVDEDMSTKGRRTQSKSARSARELAASARLDAEKRAKAAEARLNGGIKKDEDEDDDDLEDGQWEFEEEEQEDKPEMVRERYGEDEKEWLRNEIRGWENEENDTADAVGRFGGGGAGGARGGSKRKGRSSEDEGDEELTEADKIARLEKKYARGQGGSSSNAQVEDSDDDIIIVEPSTSKQKKKAKVAMCKMPARFGWSGKEVKKGEKKGGFYSSFIARSVAH
ncbi:hypothetical protein JCM5353_007753 [Sporobolomyces roseus]